MSQSERPWIAAFLKESFPSIGAFATTAMFAMVFYLLHLIAEHPELKDNELFKTVATLLVGSGAFGLCCSFIWGGTKSSSSAVEAVSEMAKKGTAEPKGDPQGGQHERRL